MKLPIRTLFLIAATFGATMPLASEPIMELGKTERITGLQYQAIDTAIRAVENDFGQPLDLKEYRFLISGERDSLAIGIVDVRRSPTMLGITGRVPEYDVYLTPDGSHVLAVRLLDD